MLDNSLHIIERIQKRWMAVSFLSAALFSIAIACLPTFLLHYFFDWPIETGIGFFILSCCIILFVDRSWQAKDTDVARFLNKNYPSLEESCELLLQDHDSLNSLQQLQAEKTSGALQQITQPSLFTKLRVPFLSAIVVYFMCWLLTLVLHPYSSSTHNNTGKAVNTTETKLPAGVKEVSVTIEPPAYTRKTKREQKSMDLQVEEGASVHWQITLNTPSAELKFLFNDTTILFLHAVNKDKTIWTTDKLITHSGFYQIKTNNIVSELYKIEVVKDMPPVILISSPKPNTVIEYGEPARINLKTSVTDDYGVKDVTINATVSKGSGEGVSFKTQKISFGTSFITQQKEYALQKLIDLPSLGMQPGDELYFYLAALDNHGQEKRSDIYIVSIIDTARLMEMDGLLNGVNLKPDYFRSQRQIIIETEQLLREKDTVPVQNFNNRSNNLGIDQKLLRLRYGKFLGEEASSNEDVTGDNGLGNPADFGNAAVILDAFTDKHDVSEDATFLDPETKKQLKATLAEMWNAELKLRTYKPQEALVYEYKALRLLKDLQQKSRAYVAKTSIKTAPIKLEKRLTGKLEKIIEPNTRKDLVVAPKPVEELRNALAVLEQLKNKPSVDDKSIQVLRLASIQISNQASINPAVYLKPLEAIKRIIQALSNKQTIAITDIGLLQAALHKLTETPALLPSKKQGTPSISLSEQYFRNLQKNKSH